MNKNFSNALINESSPYLLQHAHNPVNWFPWGKEALSIAKEKNLPILVSIGYSACHWCHVMERESFENETVAAYMNDHFLNIKIDREERPDLDHIYMDALQAMTGSGGWPLNVFLTTDAKPFYGGTYFPPQKAFNRSSWMDVLNSITQLWKTKREEVEKQAGSLIEHLQNSNSFKSLINNPADGEQDFFAISICRQMADSILNNADRVDGGFGKAPKFLQTFQTQYLLASGHFLQDESLKQHAVFTLKKMLNGGIYDQMEGGISRYSTDNEWLAPHFEKMLYDNALLVSVLCDAFQLTKETAFKDGINNTLHFVLQELKHAEGGYYTALDADSEGVEGKFYVWQKKEIEQLLGVDAQMFCDYYDVTEQGNWEGNNILNIKASAASIAGKYKLTEEVFRERMLLCKKHLLSARNQRIRPATDDKILLNSNALLITAFCKAYAAVADERYKEAAIELYEFIECRFKDPAETGCLLHTYKNGEAKFPAFLDDYAYLIEACIHLQEISSEQKYLVRAKQLMQYVIKNFSDENTVFFCYTHEQQEDIVIRKTELYDGATPSANAVMAGNLLYLGLVFEEQQWRERAIKMLNSVSNAFTKYPSSFAVWAGIYLMQTVGINEIAVTGKDIKNQLLQLLKEYLPNKILQSSTKEQNFPLLINKDFKNTATFYLCRDYNCGQPISEVSEMIGALRKILIKDFNHNN